MDFLLDGFGEAWRLVASGDRAVFHAIQVTVLCTTTAVTLAALTGFLYGTWLGVHRRDGRGLQVFLMRIGMFTPTVVVGLIVYAMLSRRGPLGALDLLYTPSAIIIGEFLLAFPLLVTITHGTVAALDRRVPETAQTLGAGRLRTLLTVMGEVRVGLVAAYLAAFARCLSELGVALTAGGSIAMRTRTLAATVTYEARRGEFARAMACSIILLVLAVGTALLAHRLSREART